MKEYYDDVLNYRDLLKARLDFGENLRRIRIDQGMSQEMLAEFTGKTREHIGFLERGERSPSFEMIIILLFVLKIDASELIAFDT